MRVAARQKTAAVATAAVAFALYRATLLPGFDFGDTGSIQTIAGSPFITPRNGYPLYFALSDGFLWLVHREPAYALNLASAIEAAIAGGLIVVLASELSGSIVAAIASALLFAGSYTFWSQAIIAEVYALHIAFVAGTWLLLLRWQDQGDMRGLVTFFAVYALGFGNHLSMILLAPGYLVFLLVAAPRGWRSMFTPRIIGTAVVIGGLGACQYLWNFRSLWLDPQPPRGLGEAVATFWFDVTKSDWRETMVLNVPRSMFADHARMYAFDLRQQFGPIVPLIALLGTGWLFRSDWRRGMLLLLLYLSNVLFAYGYNVGDKHVFYLPSHLCVAVAAAVGMAAIGSLFTRPSRSVPGVSLMLALYAAVRIYDDFPALDRSDDRRPFEVIGQLTADLDDRHDILLTDLNWQVVNGLAYYAKVVRPEVAHAHLPSVVLYAPALVNDNHEIGRDVVLTERANRTLRSAYGPLLPTGVDSRVRVDTLTDRVARLPLGTRYVLSVLKPSREFIVDADDLVRAITTLTAGASSSMPHADYAVIAGRTGEPPSLIVGANDPFHRSVRLGDVPVDIRMESWLAVDTIRRMGFGHVIAARRHTMILERGVNFVAFDASGRPIRSGYTASIFAPQPRYLVYR